MNNAAKIVWVLMLAACATDWDVCETTVDGQDACVENGSDYQLSGAGFDTCDGEGGTGSPADGTCAENGYGCAAPDAGLFLSDESCG